MQRWSGQNVDLETGRFGKGKRLVDCSRTGACCHVLHCFSSLLCMNYAYLGAMLYCYRQNPIILA